MNAVQHILLSRRSELTAKLPSLQADREKHRTAWIEASNQLRLLLEEIEKIDAALKALEIHDARSAKPTIMQAVLEVLKEHPDGMTALDILAEINKRYFEGSIARTSLSPQLSRLKDRDNKIILRGNRWFLIDREEPTLFTPKS